LALHIRLVTAGTMPIVPITLNRQSRLPTFNYKINSLVRNLMLGKHVKIPSKEFQGNIHLKPTIEWRRRFHNTPIVLGRPPFEFVPLDSGDLLLPRILEEIKQSTSKTGIAEIVTGDGMKEDHLITSTTSRNIEASLVRRLCERSDPLIGGRDKRQKHDVPLIALEAVGISTNQVTMLHLFGP
jgi:hypothetical protein